jgi:hypothetical protein
VKTKSIKQTEGQRKKASTKVHKGDLVAKPGEVYEFVEITGSLDARGADTKTAFPALTTVGGVLYASGADTKTAFPALTTTNANPHLSDRLFAACRKVVCETFLARGFYFADEILAKLVSRRGRVARVVVCGKKDVSYVVEDGQGNYSHGATLAEARSGLIYKLTSHDTSEFKAWKPKTVVSLADAIKAYRAITGAKA